MIRYIAKASTPFFTVIVSGGLIAVVLVFFAVQAVPVFGWILWAFTIVAVLTIAWRCYRNEFLTAQFSDDDNRVAVPNKEERA